MIRFLQLCFTVLLSGLLQAQKADDALTVNSFDYLYNQIEMHANKPAARPYINAFIKKAKQSKNWVELFNGYKFYIYEAEGKERLQYADSMLIAAEMAKSKELTGSAYLTRGIIYYDQKNHTEALNNYILANRIIAATDDDYLKYKTKYNIALIKYYLGYYNEAFSLFRESAIFFEEDDINAYVNCLHNLGLTCNRLGMYDESEEYMTEALVRAKQVNYKAIIPHLTLLQGVNKYYKRNLDTALLQINDALPALKKTEFGASAVGFFYAGKSLWDMGRKEKAVVYFKKIDSIAYHQKYIRPDLRQAYELLINFYHDSKQQQYELHYIKRLLAIDKILNTEFKYLAKRIHRDYDTYSLVGAKNRIERELNNKDLIQRISYIIITVLILSLGYALYRDRRLKRRYKKRFDDLISKKDSANSVSKVPSGEHLDISPEVAASILEKLETFEQKKGYLKKDITAPELAKTFDTNYKYLSKVVHHFRNKSFTVYINDLRIDNIIKELQENPKLRHYTNLALAEEAGFSTAQHFTRAFASKVNMPPSFFVQELRKREKQ